MLDDFLARAHAAHYDGGSWSADETRLIHIFIYTYALQRDGDDDQNDDDDDDFRVLIT